MTVVEIQHALHDGALLGIRLAVIVVVVGLGWLIVSDYRNVRASARYLDAPTGVTNAQGQMLTRRDLIDLAIRDVVQRQQATKSSQ